MIKLEKRNRKMIESLLKNEEIYEGSLVLFKTSRNFVNKLLYLFNIWVWCHVGILLKLNGRLMILESTHGVPTIDFLTGKKKNGVQLVDFAEKVWNYPGNVVIRPISKKLSHELNHKIFEFYDKNNFKGFPKGRIDMIYAWYDGPFGENKPKFKESKTSFCSELIAESLQHLEVLKKDIASNEFVPDDFSDFDFNKQLLGIKYENSLVHFKTKIGETKFNPIRKKIEPPSSFLQSVLKYL